jgi:type VI secretion system protein ImpH
VKLIEEIHEEPWRFDFFAVMRRLERSYPDRPRIGDAASRREEYVVLGQDPYMDSRPPT